MAKYTVTYKLEGAIDVEADSYEEACERFADIDESEKAGNTFCMGWQIDDVYLKAD